MRISTLLQASVVALTAVTAGVITAPAHASTPPLTAPQVVAHLDLAQGRQPENLTVLPNGNTVVTFAFSRQVAEIDCHGAVRILATLPAPAADAATPVLKSPFLGGVVRDDSGTLYFAYATGTADLTGIWKLAPGGTPQRIAALPADALPNGLARDERTGYLYAADSVLGTVWRVPARGGAAVPWATGADLKANGFLGANGIKIRDRAVWVSNLDNGTLLRVPVRPDGTAGPAQTVATGLTGIDDFAFTGRGNQVLAALNSSNQIALVDDNGTHTIVLNQADGLQNPTSVAVQGDRVWVADAAYLTQQDPNLLTARLLRNN
ncbi:SMP-30/gluconolactonase/LRE family protein [Kitasatospora sp. NPDC048286]|uniref:SMP-30/gluconolactonase/LRE family protein n=1 Tax=Kitasatospora sp. NPDC048286 TaxID=3364047 RepID=UPI00372400F4